MSETPEPYNAEPTQGSAPLAAQGQPTGPFDRAIQETAQAIKHLEQDEAHLKQQLEQTRDQLSRLRGRLDTLIEVSRAVVVVPNGAPHPQTERPARGRQRK